MAWWDDESAADDGDDPYYSTPDGEILTENYMRQMGAAWDSVDEGDDA